MDARAGEKMDERFEWKIERWGTDEGTLGRMYEIASPEGNLEALTGGGATLTLIAKPSGSPPSPVLLLRSSEVTRRPPVPLHQGGRGLPLTLIGI